MMYKTEQYANSFERIDLKKVNNDVRIKKLRIKSKLAHQLRSNKAIENSQIINIQTLPHRDESHEIDFRKRSSSLIKIHESRLSEYSSVLNLDRKKQSVSVVNIEKQQEKVNVLKEKHRKLNSVNS